MNTIPSRPKQPARGGLLALLAIAALQAQAAAAIVVSFSPVTQTVNVGDTAFVDLQISGLVGSAVPSLGAWAIDVGYNPSILAIDFLAGDVTFGTGLTPAGQPPSDTFGDSSTPGTVSMFETSFATPASLVALQPDSFTLARLAFRATTEGISPLTANNIELSDENGFRLTPMQVIPGEVRVGVIPEPGTAVFVAGLLLTIATERRRKHPAKVTCS